MDIRKITLVDTTFSLLSLLMYGKMYLENIKNSKRYTALHYVNSAGQWIIIVLGFSQGYLMGGISLPLGYSEWEIGVYEQTAVFSLLFFGFL